MSDRLTHECGLAFVRLRKPLHYYQEQYGDAAWGLRKTYLLMQKQYNRGQDGAGLGVVKFDMPAGDPFLLRVRSDKHNAIERIFDVITEDTERLGESISAETEMDAKRTCRFLGEAYLGHLRYGTHSNNSMANCHPFIRKSNIASRNIALAGNFNMTNSSDLFRRLVEYGLDPVGDNDTQVILEKISHFLNDEHERLIKKHGNLEGRDLAKTISKELDIGKFLTKAAQYWDGGYVFASLIGNGDAFICRDPAGIRPAFIYINDEVVACASERGALANVFNVSPDEIQQVEPGHVVVIKRNGTIEEVAFTEQLETRQCSFERIYFSRGNDPLIYNQRKRLGANLAPRIMKVLGDDIKRSFFSYIPNTAETCFLGLLEAVGGALRSIEADVIWDKIQDGSVTRTDLTKLNNTRVQAELIAHKDQRLRTFITHDAARRDLVTHIYDITRGLIEKDDTLVVVDDSIVRGTTLRESIITSLSQLHPKRIVIVSSAPPIMYPDCYGIDMSQIGKFIAFEAAISLTKDAGNEAILDEIAQKCKEQEELPVSQMQNQVKALYEQFSLKEISCKIAELVRPSDLAWNGQLDVIYQDVEGLHAAMPAYTGDWYFTGNYPTPGGNTVVNRAYLNWFAGDDAKRAY
ncbi:MAG: class II glutamine amidotransferase [Phycisphaerales bacterium]|nr:class II glutamine amidotransferase [Planctomycetota bacterium]MBL6997098.1 class II glutamine amidotransferase [Phycisphaerales bacterium]